MFTSLSEVGSIVFFPPDNAGIHGSDKFKVMLYPETGGHAINLGKDNRLHFETENELVAFLVCFLICTSGTRWLVEKSRGRLALLRLDLHIKDLTPGSYQIEILEGVRDWDDIWKGSRALLRRHLSNAPEPVGMGKTRD